MRYGIYMFLISALMAPLALFAQGVPGISDPLTLTLFPENPRPNETVTARIQSFSIDLDAALITWTVNGKEVSSGVGQKSVSVDSGRLGSLSRIDVSVTTPNASVSESIVIRPADVSLVWEADTYVPPFYRGKALHSYNGSFRVTAVPEFVGDNGRAIDPKDLIYTWKKNGAVVGEASGYGKNQFVSTQTSYLREGEDITVEVSSPRESIVASRSVTIQPVVPKIVFYEKSGLYGARYQTAVGNRFSLTNDEVTFVAEPFFFSVTGKNDPVLLSTWKLNGRELVDFSGDMEITLRRDNNTAGRSEIRLVLQSTSRVLQGASGLTLITFDEKNN